MAKNIPDDPFKDDDWGPTDGTAESENVPEATIDPERTPFLKPFHMKERQGKLELLKASGGTEYSDIVLHVKYGSTHFRLGLKSFDPAFQALRKKFGPKRADWHGPLVYKIMPHAGRADGYVAVRPA